MPNPKGPWQRPPKRIDPRLRVVLWLGCAIALGYGVWELSALFPGTISSDWDKANVAMLIGLVALFSTGAIFSRRFSARDTLRNIALWGGLAAVLILGYAYQDELSGAWLRVRSQLVPGYAVTTGAHELTVNQSANGQFYVVAQVNGMPVRFMIDTGASDIVLAPADAMRLGIDMNALDFSKPYETANGVGRGARVTLKTLAVGPIALDDVTASVNQSDMGESLLGLAFLSRLASVQITGRTLILRWN